MEKYFDTREQAEKDLEKRRKAYLKKCDKMGWKVVGDNSFVYQNFIWKKDGPYGMVQTDILKWFVWMAIVTDEMLNDLKNCKGMDIEKIQQIESEAVEMAAKGISEDIIKRIVELGIKNQKFYE